MALPALPGMLTAVTRLAKPVTDTLGAVLGASTGRRMRTAGDRLDVEVRGVHRPGTEEAVEALRQRLLALDGVSAVEVNGHWGRAVITRDPEVTDSRDIVDVVTALEQEWDLARYGQAPASARHPANSGPAIRELAALGISLAGAGYTVATRALPGRLPAVWPSLFSLAESSPRIRAIVARQLGRPVADTIFAIGGATGQALARSPLGLLTHTTRRLLQHREVTARQQAWQHWESTTAGRPGLHEAAALESPPRPTALPAGPIERLADISVAAALAGFATALVATRNSDRATALLTSGTPRAAFVGREAFASQLDTHFSRAGSLVLEPDALRRLDRVDTVVLDGSILTTGRYIVDSVAPVGKKLGETELSQRAHDLLDTRHPKVSRERDGWVLAPVNGASPAHVRRRAQQLSISDNVMLALQSGNRAVGLVRVVPEIDPMAEALLDAARQAGPVLLAGGRPGLRERLPADGAVAGGHRLPEVVRGLQAQGRVVAVVSRQRAALAAADVGLAVHGPGGTVPWDAHVVCPDAGQVALLLSAAGVARRTSTDVARVCIAGSVIGALLGGLGPAAGATTRASVPVHLGGMLAIALGAWRAVTVGTRPAPQPVDRTPWHEMSPRAVLALLSSSRDGLTEAESARRHGRSAEPEDVGETGLVQASADELANPLTPALAAGAGISASLGSITDALLITGVLALNGLIGGAQRVGANRELRRLLETSSAPVRLRREGVVREARAADLAPGDVIELRAGDAVPADCRLMEATGLEVDESSLTGESQLVVKTAQATSADEVADRVSMIYQGTVVASGHAVAVVVVTGERTEAARGARTTGEAPRTGVEARLRELAGRTLPIAAVAGALLMGVDLLRGRGLGKALSQSVGLAVAAVPEGLPFVATVAELASARRLSHQGVLVRSASTIEALGRVGVLCFDKTGTLTEGRIGLRRVSDGAVESRITNLTPALEAVLATAVRASPWQESDARVPHPTDRAVLEGARELGITAGHGMQDLQWITEIAFEPARGYHATLMRHADGFLLSAKGAPEIMLGRCVRWQRPDGYHPFNADALRQVEGQIERLASHGYRVLAVAERSASDRAELDDERVQRLDFRGLVALADRVRPTAAAAVDRLRRAGVDVVMVTGDHPGTAAAIGAELDMIDGRGVLTGAELDSLDERALAEVLPEIGVFARVSPTQKASLVRQLRKAGRVVAMTGDGANDAPAIRLAHVGIALGSRATPAAREAADLVVTDDRIETITAALLEGRAMWSSVRDAVGILLGGNLGEIAFTLLSGLFGTSDTLNARQLLLVNLLTDVLPAMAVAVRPPPDVTADELLEEGPEASLGGAMLHDIYRRAAVTAGAATAGWMLARPASTPGQASTTALVSLVGGQLAQTIAIRGRTPLVVGAGLASLVVLGTVVQVPGLSQFFGCRPLLPHQWAIAAGASGAAGAAELLWRVPFRKMISR
ncbi:haloacid dehalogenase [Amycolatopsis taiwanensis]|uniref:Haloacid dehalogenase n=2 Tax=Amycolatopsis taiwanensis TaxID=342230 RepID=A0A9W6QWY0_9PSEU|nr:haloacid dehalogenase [Amycolatopsis taiwanensis]